MAGDASKLMKFPSFTGKDLDGNDVNSSDLFSGNTVTVVNFWFTSCKPCVSELADLEALNKELAAKGGGVVGINSFTLDGNKRRFPRQRYLSKKAQHTKIFGLTQTARQESSHRDCILTRLHMLSIKRQYSGSADSRCNNFTRTGGKA